MRYATYDKRTGKIKGFHLVNQPQKDNQILIDLGLYDKLLSNQYKVNNLSANYLNVLHTLKDLHLFSMWELPQDTLGRDGLDEVVDSLKSDVLEVTTELSTNVLSVTKNVLNNKNSIKAQQLVNETQDYDIMCTQDALDFLLFSMVNDTMNMRVSSEDTPSSKTTGGVNMGAYFTTRIIRKGKLSVDMGRAYYSQVKAQYPEYIEEVDFLLISEGYENLIVK